MSHLLSLLLSSLFILAISSLLMVGGLNTLKTKKLKLGSELGFGPPATIAKGKLAVIYGYIFVVLSLGVIILTLVGFFMGLFESSCGYYSLLDCLK